MNYPHVHNERDSNCPREFQLFCGKPTNNQASALTYARIHRPILPKGWSSSSPQLWQQRHALLLISASALHESALVDSLRANDSTTRSATAPRRSGMLDGKAYFGEFPDEDPARLRPLLQSPRLIASLRALEKELRPYFTEQSSVDMDAEEPPAS